MKRVLLLLGIVVLARPAATQDLSPGGRPAVAPLSGWRFLPNAGIAFDTFGQRYVVAEEETLDVLDEWSGRITTTLERNGRTSLRLRNTFGLGQEATRNDLQLALARQGQRATLRFEEDLRLKLYTADSDYSLSSDYLVSQTRLSASFRFMDHWRLRVQDRLEWTAFERRDRYNYDYRINDTGMAIERSYGFFSLLGAGYGFGVRAVPDSSAIDYRRHVLTAEWQHEVGLHTTAMDHRLERRLYGDPAVRSHTLDYDGGASARIALHSALRLRPEARARILRYDRPDSVYANTVEPSLELLLEGDPSTNTILAIGPRAEFRRTRGGIDRPYNQWGLKGSITWSVGSKLWLQFSDEIGVRSHFAGDDLLYSDYVFNWSTLYLTWEPLPRLAFDLFFSLEPEDHEDEDDNTTTLLLSTALTYGWR
jgi:hypothetical protein